MFKSKQPAQSRRRATATRDQILSTALSLFRNEGLDSTTMRDIAKEADVALGAAYYYFASKEAILQAYYDQVQTLHRARVVEKISTDNLDLRGRIGASFHAKLDILEGDRKILGALFRYAGEPDHPLSALGPGTRQNREQSIAVFDLAIGNERLPRDIRAMLPSLLWAAHMGILLYFIYDDSPGQVRTRKLVDGAVGLMAAILSLARLPLLKPFRGRLAAMLCEAGLAPGSTPIVSVADSPASKAPAASEELP